MKQFLLKTTLFCLPLLVLFSIPMVLLYTSGEGFRGIDTLIESRQKYLIGYAYSEVNYRYLKKKEIQIRPAQSVIAVGSSRILQFREAMLKDSFYNAGYTITKITEVKPFIASNLQKKKPDVLLLALDQWMFNENYDAAKELNPTDHRWEADFTSKIPTRTYLNVWSDLLDSKYSISDVFAGDNSTCVGLNALINGQGFRKDGSMNYGDQVKKLLRKDSTANDYGFADTYSRIETGGSLFEFGHEVNPQAIRALDDLLSYCKREKIYVVAFLPPYAQAVYEKMKLSGKYTYIDGIYPAAKQVFEKYNFELWDFTELHRFNSNDTEMIDGFHGSEVTYLKMLLYMLENGSVLQEKTDVIQLRRDLSRKTNRYQIYNSF